MNYRFILLFLYCQVSCTHHAARYGDHSRSFLDQKKEKSYLNQIIKDLSFFPINDLHFRLSDLKNKKAIVIIMRERDCPISEKYGSRLVRLEKKYSKRGVQFIYNYE